MSDELQVQLQWSDKKNAYSLEFGSMRYWFDVIPEEHKQQRDFIAKIAAAIARGIVWAERIDPQENRVVTTNQDTRYCEHCDEDTLQECHDSTHERDSSDDYQKCLKCGWYRLGMTGKWNPSLGNTDD